MLNTRLIQKLLKYLWQVLGALAHSSAQRLRILVFCLWRCVAKVHTLPGHNTDSKSSTADPYCAKVSNAQCPPATLPLPLHHQITSTDTAVGTQSMVLSPSIPAPYIPEQVTPSHTSSSPGVTNANPSNAPGIVRFVPFAANDVLRYDNRPLVYVQRPRDSGRS
ncbi:hypothetical protein BD769DRAFT_999976 [Suillus cothurnatus]|nr:hypothetical protein BD769DRAFT_999976 [Suillus cothurnatus]